MLVINNIQKLIGTYIGKWEVMGADIDYESGSKSPEHNYNIRLTRRDKMSIGAAIIIERTEGDFGYNVSICYEEYDNVISVNAVGKNELKNKDIFLSLMRGVLDAEYDNQQLN